MTMAVTRRYCPIAGRLLKVSGQSPPVFEAVDAALDDVAPRNDALIDALIDVLVSEITRGPMCLWDSFYARRAESKSKNSVSNRLLPLG